MGTVLLLFFRGIHNCIIQPLSSDSSSGGADASTLNLVNKYYSASITMDLEDIASTDESVLDNAEGYILVPSEVKASQYLYQCPFDTVCSHPCCVFCDNNSGGLVVAEVCFESSSSGSGYRSAYISSVDGKLYRTTL